LTLSSGVTALGDTAQNWSVASGRLLTVGGTFTRSAGATLNFDLNGSTVTLSSGTASVLLLNGNAPYATINRVDYAALDGSKNVVSGVSFYGDYSLGGNLSGTYGSPILNITGTTAGSTQAWRNSNTFIVPNGVRFNAANTQNTKWTVDTSSSGRLLTTGAILVGPDVGTQDVEFNGSGGVRANGSAADLILHQNNPSGNLIFNTVITTATGSSASPLIKTGPGRVILNAANSYTGTTKVEAGTLLVNGSTTASSTVNVNAGATLGGSGTINGAINLANGATLLPGNQSSVGALTANGALTFNAGAQTLGFYGIAVPTTNTTALLVVSNNLVVNGTVNVSIRSGKISVGQYPLLRWTNAISGTTFASFNLAGIAPHVTAYLSNNTASSTIDLVVTAVNLPLKWATGSGTWDLVASNWKDNLGATTTYQEFLGLGDSVLFEDTESGGSPITVTLNTRLTPASTTVGATKNYTISGTGGIAGAGSLTKSGSGTLTLTTANSFSGGLALNGGTVTFSSLTNLGAGAISFAGGTLKYASGNSDDVSVRGITINAGDATFDVGSSTVNFANAIGNSGAGGLIKQGSGTLTLNGTNRYSGNTVIGGGTLVLGSATYISNSAAIIVNSGATFDVTANSPITLAAGAAQALVGSGSVNGSVTVPASTKISPATNGVVGTLTLSSGDLTINGGTIAADLTTSTRDLIVVNGNLTITSGTLQLNVTGTLANGSYTLIQYTGGLTGAAGNLAVAGYAPAGKAVTLDDSVSGQINLVVADTATDAITWSGATSGDWDLIGSLNWLKGVTSWAYTNGDLVTFDDSGSAQPNISLKAAVAPGSVTVNSSANYTFADGTGTGGGKISGATAITKSGTGTLVIDTINNNTGTLTVNAGTVQVGDGGTTGALGSGNVVNNSALTFMQTDNRTVSGAISGTGILTQQGSAAATTLTLSGTQSYTGPTVINSGTLQVGTGGTAGAMASSSVTNNGFLVLNSATSWTLAAPVVGTGGLTKQATNTITFGGDKSYTGRTTVEGGKIVLSAADQLKGELRVQAGGTVDINGLNQSLIGFSSTPVFSGGRLVNNTGTATNVVTLTNSTDFDCSVIVADNDGTGGAIAVVKQGPGLVQWRGASSYSGGTTIREGSMRVTTSTAFGTGPIAMLGGRLVFGATTIGNSITVVSNCILEANGNSTFSGPLTGTNTIDFQLDANEVFTWNGAADQMAGFTGTFLIRPGGGNFRFNGSRGSASATFDMTGSTAQIASFGTGNYELGALIGDTSPFLGAIAGSTFTIGGKNLSTTFSGTFNSGNNSLVKVGTGTFTIDGTYSFTGTTVVSNGVLAIASASNPSTSLDTSSAITVRSGASVNVLGRSDTTLQLGNSIAQTLSGGGTVSGNVTATGGAVATILPGDGIGKLTVSGALTLAANSLVTMELNRTNAGATNDMISAASIVPNDATLTVTNIGPDLYTGSTFKLFNGPVSGFAAINLPTQNAAGTITYQWQTNIATDGTIKVLAGASPIATNPTNITYSVSGNTLSLSWPADHLGWKLQVQTNTLGTGLSGNWIDIPNSTAVTQTNLTVDPVNGAVFYRLIYTQP
jgi:fibronectin-binding autotransporter adhesin